MTKLTCYSVVHEYASLVVHEYVWLPLYFSFHIAKYMRYTRHVDKYMYMNNLVFEHWHLYYIIWALHCYTIFKYIITYNPTGQGSTYYSPKHVTIGNYILNGNKTTFTAVKCIPRVRLNLRNTWNSIKCISSNTHDMCSNSWSNQSYLTYWLHILVLLPWMFRPLGYIQR